MVHSAYSFRDSGDHVLLLSMSPVITGSVVRPGVAGQIFADVNYRGGMDRGAVGGRAER